MIEQTTKEENASKNLNFFTDLAMVPSKSISDEPQHSTKPGIIPTKNRKENGDKPSTRSSLT